MLQTDPQSLEKLAQSAAVVVRQAADFLRKEAASFSWDKVEYKGLNDLVSYVDRETEQLLVAGLAGIVPNAQFLTEEGTVAQAAESADNPYWIIDPLDGTTNFTHGLPPYAVSVGLYYHGEIVVGIVHEVTHDEQFVAWKGGGSWCNGRRLQLPQSGELGQALLATGFPYNIFSGLDAYLDILAELMVKCHGLRRMGSASVDLAYVAAGRFQGFFEYNLKAWDVAAGILLVQEAGGYVSDFVGGNNYLFGKQIVAAGYVHPDLLAVVKSHWPKSGL